MEGQYPRPKDLIGLLGVLWALPICVLVWIFLLILMITGQTASVKMGPYMSLIVDMKNSAKFCQKNMVKHGWAGYGWGNVVFAVDTDTERWHRTVLHELTHVFQQYFLGILHPIMYFLISVVIFVFILKLHSYYDNPFERQARRRAGQPVKIPKEQWAQGPYDRWAWW